MQRELKNPRPVTFPPQPDHEHEWTALSGMLSCAVNGREAEYVSTPLSTGLGFIEWYRSIGKQLTRDADAYRRAHEASVIAVNALRARHFIERLRTERRIVIEPTSLNLPHWTQNDYRHLWGQLIERYARRVWLLDGWQFSSGCAFEFYVASQSGIETLSQHGTYISRRQGSQMIADAVIQTESLGLSADFLRAVSQALAEIRHIEIEILAKDETLARLAASHNVAQFVSFGPGAVPGQRYCRIAGVPDDYFFKDVEAAVSELLKNSADGTVNVRSFRPGDDTSYPFEYGIKTATDAADLVRKHARSGLNTIVNETIDIHDGGVSGVLADNFVEFAPDDTPRCVERPGTARLPLSIAETILQCVYGIHPELDREPTRRVEFSIHPRRRGVRRDHTLIWEIGSLDDFWSAPPSAGSLQVGPWPNRFSRMLGDKTYGLLIAHAAGFAVPFTSVFSSRISSFDFGRSTGVNRGCWLRTAPAVNQPGRYETRYIPHLDLSSLAAESTDLTRQNIAPAGSLLAWTAVATLRQHGFLLTTEASSDPDSENIEVPSVLAQQSVASAWSGSLITQSTGAVIEGVRGFGDEFMMGQRNKEALPQEVRTAVSTVRQQLEDLLGPISMEWAFDGKTVWVLQLHQELSTGFGHVIVPGNAESWYEFDMSNGLRALRDLADKAASSGRGIEFTEDIGATSHAAATVRKKGVPARIRVA